jgi:ABC-2 type transport system ATP-binding protein
MTESSNYTLELNNVSKKFSGKTVVNNISLQIKEGEVFGLLGPNGAGKTTIIRMIVGLIRPTSGQIRLLGSDIHKNFKDAIRGIGAIVENPDFYLHLTGYQNLKILARMTRRISNKSIEKVIAFVDLTDNIHQRVSTYSLGMRQRLGIAQALLHHPKLLILDEPTNGLDPIGMRELRKLIHKLSKEMGVSILISSHYLSEMQEICENVGVMKQGQLICVKDVESLVSESLNKYRITVSKVAFARKIAEELGWTIDEVTSSSFIVTGRKDPAKLTNKLIKEGGELSSIEPITPNLEEVFMKLLEEEGAKDESVG